MTDGSKLSALFPSLLGRAFGYGPAPGCAETVGTRLAALETANVTACNGQRVFLSLLIVFVRFSRGYIHD
jgi:hypothetical protein